MNKMREQFEKWALSEGLDVLKDESGAYFYDSTDGYWIAWKASRENLVIELPIAHEGLFQDCLAFDETDVKLALEEQGVKYK